MSCDTHCRLCAIKTDRVINIYDEEGEKLSLATKIIQCLQIWLYPEDVLPKVVCIDCCAKVDSFFEFFHMSSQSQLSLMTIYNKSKNEEEKAAVSPQIVNVTNGTNNDNLDHMYEGDITEEYVEYTDLGPPEENNAQPENTFENTSKPEPKLVEEKIQPLAPTLSQSQRKPDTRREDPGEVDDESEDESITKLLGKDNLKKDLWKCSDCPADLTSLADLRRHHADIHNQLPVFTCTLCSKSYTRYRSYSRHVRQHSQPLKFGCDICGKMFAQKTVLQSHATVHSDERPFSCTDCGRAFKQLSSLYLHNKKHLPAHSKPTFSCSLCPKEFATKQTLETHLRLHSGERNYVCDMCGKRFIAKNSLDYHIMTHGDTKPHTCKVCGKGFKTPRLLMKHSTLHTGVKPHQCDVCGKQFRERGALKEHNRIHTGAMPYACDFCGKLFRFKGILTVHRRQHTGERPYSCGECQRHFTNWANYNKHMKRRHREVRDTEQETMLVTKIIQREAQLSTALPASQFDTCDNYVDYYVAPTQ